MSLTAGSQVGPCTLLSLLGAGWAKSIGLRIRDWVAKSPSKSSRRPFQPMSTGCDPVSGRLVPQEGSITLISSWFFLLAVLVLARTSADQYPAPTERDWFVKDFWF